MLKKANLKTIADTENLVNRTLSKMNLSQLMATEEFVKAKQLKDGINEGNMIFLKLVREKIDKYGK
jgi:hypothetical protein